MITPAFTKLQRSIVTSSIWLESAETRLVWITLLALCDRDGIVRASPLGLAHQARVSPDGCRDALERFQRPDPDSRSPEHEGRRIERVDGGFLVLNHQRILSEGAREERREYNRAKQAEVRARKRANGETIRPEHRDDKGKPKRSRKPVLRANGFIPPRIAPPEEEHPKSYEQYHKTEGCGAPGQDSLA